MEERKCGNCVHYVQHYKIKGAILREIGYGHCANRMCNGRERKTDKPCDCWKTAENLKEERKKTIIETLESMSENLRQITMILKEQEQRTKSKILIINTDKD